MALMNTNHRLRCLIRVAGACIVLAVAGLAGGLWYRQKTTPLPYSQRWALDKELPYLTRECLCRVLAPRPGERILEIGPGTRLFSVPVAQRLAPGGRLDVFDIQQAMLAHTLRVASAHDVANLVATRDAQRLPYLEDTFDAAFMMTVLGELDDQEATPRELQRVLKPGGRLVIGGEFIFDWHAVPFEVLKRRAKRQEGVAL